MFYYTTTSVQIDLLEEIGLFLYQFGLWTFRIEINTDLQGLVTSLFLLSTRRYF